VSRTAARHAGGVLTIPRIAFPTGGLARGRPARVLVAGGGFAALEALLALRALAGDRVAIELVSPQRQFAYRPAATAEPFGDEPPLAYDLPDIARDLRAAHRVDRLEAVAPAVRSVRLASGAHLDYDALILAVGAQLRASVPGALMFTGPREARHIRGLLDDLVGGRARSVIFAVPSGVSWPLPLYELALHTAGFARQFDAHVEVSIVTPEHEPLDLFGEHGSALVRTLLDERGVRFLGERIPERFDRDGRLTLRFGGGVLRADRVIAAPNMVGRAISGIPGSWHGFVPTDAHGRVDGLDDVYAAGDMTTFPVKQGGLAAQQADAIAADITRRLGAHVPADPPAPVLRARLIGGARPVALHAALDADGRALDARLDTESDPLIGHAPPQAKVFGRFLTPYLAERTTARVAAAEPHTFAQPSIPPETHHA
jgi:sulfide:quinone oxidoreductase